MNDELSFYIIQCRSNNVILGLPWLCNANSTIEWTTGIVELPDSKPSQPMEDVVTQRYLKQYNGRCEEASIVGKLLKRNTYVECVGHTTISTSLAVEKEKKTVVLPPEFSDFVDVFRKPKVPLPLTDPSTTPLNSPIPLFHVRQRTICSTPRK